MTINQKKELAIFSAISIPWVTFLIYFISPIPYPHDMIYRLFNSEEYVVDKCIREDKRALGYRYWDEAKEYCDMYMKDKQFIRSGNSR